MCGIVGVITKDTKARIQDQDKFMHWALIWDTMRGKDSTGVFGVEHGSEDMLPAYTKIVVPGNEFVARKDFEKWQKPHYRFAVGHNRAATVGNVDSANAHPFREGNITLVHNGTLRTTHELPLSMHEANKGRCNARSTHRKKNKNKEIEIGVDSQLLALNLARHPVEDVISKINGSFALVWHDARTGELNMIRNSERPLHIGITSNEDAIFFMSEGPMLKTLCDKLKIHLKTIVQPDPGVLLRFSAEGGIVPRAKKLKLAHRTYSGDGSGYSRGYRGGYKGNHSHSGYSPALGPAFNYSIHDSNTIRTNGRDVAVPGPAQEGLLEINHVVEDRLSFIPLQSKEGRNGNVTVFGYCPETYEDIMIHGVNSAALDRGKRRVWEVRPIGVNFQSEYEYHLVCLVCTTYGNQKGVDAHTKEVIEDDDLFDDRPLLLHNLLEGRYGEYVSMGVWMKHVQGGCIQCQDNLDPSHAEDILWVNGGHDPLCIACQQEKEIA